jgi:hypothetical protein
MSSEVRDKAVEKFSFIRPETAPIFEGRQVENRAMSRRSEW